MNFGESFLSQPDLFPARQSGERWGSERVVIGVAGTDYVGDGLSTAQAAELYARFGRLCAPSGQSSQPAVEMKIFRAAASDFVDGDRLWEYEFDIDYAPSSVVIAGFHFMGRLDWVPHLKVALWTSEESRLVSQAIFENVLRVVVAYRLLEQGGLLLHSAAVVNAGHAFVFFGPSGAGKSTISSISFATGRAVLSDDMNALRVTANGIVVEKLPFAGDFGQSPRTTADGAYGMRDLCRLEKGKTAALRDLRAAPAVAALLECAPFVNRNPYRYDDLIGNLVAIQARQPVRVLTFARDAGFWGVLCSGSNR